MVDPKSIVAATFWYPAANSGFSGEPDIEFALLREFRIGDPGAGSLAGVSLRGCEIVHCQDMGGHIDAGEGLR